MKHLLLFLLFPLFMISQTQIGSDIIGEHYDDNFGLSTSMSSDGNIVAIGAFRNNGIGFYSGDVRVFENQGGNWVQLGLDINGENEFDESGSAISLSSDGNIVAIGASLNDGNGNNSGHVRVFENQGGNWVQLGQDINGENEFDESGGRGLSISANGSVIAIGATGNDGNGNNSGHVRVFENQGGNWVQVGQDINGEASSDASGSRVSLSDDGLIVAIGAPGNNGNNGSNSGHVRVFENQGGNWVQLGQDLDAEAVGDGFSTSLSISSNGSIIAVGAEGNDGNGNFSGHVQVFENQGGNWVQLGSDIDGEAENDVSGRSVSLSDDGTVVVIGAPGNNGNGDDSGHVRIYKFVNNSWIQIGVDIDGMASFERFGWSVSLNNNGSKVVIGAIDAADAAGVVRIYDLSALLSTNKFVLSQFKLYPNPVKDQFTIQLNQSLKLLKANIYNS